MMKVETERASLAQVGAVLLVLIADVFKNVAVRYQLQFSADAERSSVILRVIEGDLQIHVTEIAAAITLCNVHGFAARVSESVEPSPVIEADCVDYKSIALPPPD